MASIFTSFDGGPPTTDASGIAPITTADPSSSSASQESLTSRVWTITDGNGNPSIVTLPPIPNETPGGVRRSLYELIGLADTK